MREPVEIHYPDAETVRVVLDTLSAHKPAAMYEKSSPLKRRQPSIISTLDDRSSGCFMCIHAIYSNQSR